MSRNLCLAFARLLLVVVLTRAVHASVNLLENPSFDDDLSGWSFETTRPAEMVWDADLGNPSPGSLRIRGSDGTSGFIVGEAFSDQCFVFPGGSLLRLDAMTRAENLDGQAGCYPFFGWYSEAGCTGERAFLGNLNPDTPDVWQQKSSGFIVPPGGRSFRIGLVAAVVVGEGEIACNFDSVALYEVDSFEPARIPVTAPMGLFLLAGALGFTALWWLHRAH